ncbi:Manganese-transporting ATPase 1 [Nakaseomyces glabratus]|uniref:Manganese-transporting ATPase 1 n=1 Tax=Candida glabrata TaxID=5478 RepID=A0A0W0DNI4_CANGB|nr:Manganese-transporting ATPase 1 [Nakaseomyces glabratus]
MADKVNSPIVKDSQLLIPKSLTARPYTLPFFPLYATFAQIYFQQYDTYIKGPEWTFVYLGTIVSLNILVLLLPEWNIQLAAKFKYNKVDNINEATHILINTTPNNGSSDIVKIERANEMGELQTFFQFQKKRFLWHEDEQQFSSPKFLIDGTPKISEFQNFKGHKGDLTHLRRLYGNNEFDIPIPTFLELFKEHAVAPLFVFQVFCVALWLLDEYWYLSLFNLFMILSMEAASVFQRLTALKEFRTMGVKPYAINVLRDGKWVEMQTNELLPMDVVSVVRTAEDSALPCDLILVDGTCIVNEAMLSGESTPLLKESIRLRPGNEELQIEGTDKISVLHGGTKVLQVTTPEKTGKVPSPPDGGAIAIVTKTGFETSQGSLVRVMIYSSERVGVDNKEALYFILFLLIFAVVASWYVWVEGTKMGRVQSKLILDCILIITSVVPPELPMELTMAVNSSLSALSKFYVYCTEPFRIPFAGRIDVCCFDKTGTLTGEDLVFEGLAGLSSDPKDIRHLYSATDCPNSTSLVVGAAHALVRLEDGEIVGDPMEKATLKALKWTVEKGDKVFNEKNGQVTILRRFQFSSALKRSSSVATHDGKLYSAVKGAPETIRERLFTIPANYDEIYKSFTRSGSRVLALASKKLEKMSQSQIEDADREHFERDLEFNGFLIFHCPLKHDAIETIQMLNESAHRCVMITGDNPLTAVHVAKEVGIVKGETLIVDMVDNGNDDKLVFRNVEETLSFEFVVSKDSFEKYGIFDKYDLAVTGHALEALKGHHQLQDLIRHAWIYARVSPAQKEFILNNLKDMGYQTLMCGDETPTLKLGDASCAAPFTSKLANVSAVTNIIRQGRCALVNTIQMYKILALNCLISAYSLSIIYMAGVKFGDGQATTSGLLLSVCFLSISRGKPLQKLSKARPQAGIFNVYIMGSILSQFVVHIGTLIYLTNEIYRLEPREPQVDLEKEFAPSLLNTGIFIIQLVQQVSTFAVNYQGEPFRENIRSNKGMYYGLLGVTGLALASATEFIPELNEAMKFVPMEDDFKMKLTITLFVDFFGCWGAEHFFKFFFMDDTPADITEEKVRIQEKN